MPKILIVEDEEILRELMAGELDRHDYTVLTAINGQEGLVLFDKEQPDLILLDLLMPIMTGYDFLKAIRSLSDQRQALTPCIVLSNSGQIDDLNRAYICGADDVLIKADFNPAQLVVKVREILEKKDR